MEYNPIMHQMTTGSEQGQLESVREDNNIQDPFGIKSAKDYQLQICMNKMKTLYKEASDNLTGRIAMTIKSQCEAELKLRGVELDYWS